MVGRGTSSHGRERDYACRFSHVVRYLDCFNGMTDYLYTKTHIDVEIMTKLSIGHSPDHKPVPFPRRRGLVWECVYNREVQ